MPKSVPPSPALHIRLIGAFHKFLQSQGAIHWDRPVGASHIPASPLRYGLTSHYGNQFRESPAFHITAATYMTLATSSSQASDLRKPCSCPCTASKGLLEFRAAVETGVNSVGQEKVR